MAEDEVYNIILRVEGESDVKALTEKIRQEEQTLATLVKGLGNVSVAHLRMNAEVQTSVTAIQSYNAQLRAAQSLAVTFGSTTAGSAGRAGQALSQIGYAVDDLQYGFRGIANNIQPILSSIPMLSSMAGPISIAAIATYQLYTHWDDLMRLMGTGKVRTQAEEMAELKKQTELTAEQAERLYRLEQQAGKRKEVTQGKTESQKKAEDIATQAVIEAGAKNVRALVLNQAPERLDADAQVIEAKKNVQTASRPAGHIDPRTGERIVAPGEAEARQAAINDSREALIRARREAAEKIRDADLLPQLFPGGIGDLRAMAARAPGIADPKKTGLIEQLGVAQMQAEETPADRNHRKAREAEEKDAEGVEKTRKQREAANEKTFRDLESWEKQEDQTRKQKEAADRRGVKEVEDYEKEAARDSLKKAKDDNPGMTKALETFATETLRGGADPKKIQEDFEKKLRTSFGLDEETAGTLAGEAVRGGRENLVSEGLRGDRPSTSATHGGTDFAAAVQSGVGGEDKHLAAQEKGNEIMKRAADALDRMAADVRNADGKVRPT